MLSFTRCLELRDIIFSMKLASDAIELDVFTYVAVLPVNTNEIDVFVSVNPTVQNMIEVNSGDTKSKIPSLCIPIFEQENISAAINFNIVEPGDYGIVNWPAPWEHTAKKEQDYHPTLILDFENEDNPNAIFGYSTSYHGTVISLCNALRDLTNLEGIESQTVLLEKSGFIIENLPAINSIHTLVSDCPRTAAGFVRVLFLYKDEWHLTNFDHSTAISTTPELLKLLLKESMKVAEHYKIAAPKSNNTSRSQMEELIRNTLKAPYNLLDIATSNSTIVANLKGAELLKHPGITAITKWWNINRPSSATEANFYRLYYWCDYTGTFQSTVEGEPSISVSTLSEMNDDIVSFKQDSRLLVIAVMIGDQTSKNDTICLNLPSSQLFSQIDDAPPGHHEARFSIDGLKSLNQRRSLN